MTLSRSSWLIALLTLFAALAPVTSQAQLNRDPDALTMIADGLVARPAGAAVTVVGVAAFVVTLPFSAISQSTRSAWDSMVGKPARFTFRRPLGHFPQGS